MELKTCTKCGEEKPFNCFSTAKTGSHGLRGDCKECRNNINRQRYENNKEERSRQIKEYQDKNKEKLAKSRLEYMNNRYKTDISFKLKTVLSVRINKALKRNSKSSSSEQLLGCSLQFLRDHLQSQFTEGMSWDNYGDWHIDHIKPCASFDLSKPEEQRKCFHYTNLQPLWAEDNLKKSNKMILTNQGDK